MLLKVNLNQTVCEIFSPIFLCECVNYVMAFTQSHCEDVNEISLTEANWAHWGFYVCVGVWIYNCACVCGSVRSANYSFPVTSADHTNVVSTLTCRNILISLNLKSLASFHKILFCILLMLLEINTLLKWDPFFPFPNVNCKHIYTCLQTPAFLHLPPCICGHTKSDTVQQGVWRIDSLF